MYNSSPMKGYPLKQSMQYGSPASQLKQTLPVGQTTTISPQSAYQQQFNAHSYLSNSQMQGQQLYPQLKQSMPPQSNAQTLYNTSQVQGIQRVSQVHNVEHMPLVHEVHHIERPVQVVGIEEVEQPWRAKVITLEKQLIELELMLKKRGKGTQETVVVEDVNRIKRLQDQIREFENLIRDKNQHINNQNDEIARLEQELEESSSYKTEALNDELGEWKKKFIDLNRKFHGVQEEEMLRKAEVESLKNKKTITQVTTTETKRQH